MGEGLLKAQKSLKNRKKKAAPINECKPAKSVALEVTAQLKGILTNQKVFLSDSLVNPSLCQAAHLVFLC